MRGWVIFRLVALALVGAGFALAAPPAHAARDIIRGWGKLEAQDRRAAKKIKFQRLKDCPREDETADFGVFFAGNPFEGLPITHLGRACQSLGEEIEEFEPQLAVRHRTNFVSFVYGDCDDPPCVPPLEIQVWPACERNPGRYDSDFEGPLRFKRYRIRGVPVADYGDGLEIHTGDSTVVIFFNDRRQAFRAALALRGTSGTPAADQPLPPPRPGVISGRIRCSYRS